MLMNKSWWRESRRVQTTSRPCQRSRCLGSRWRGWRMRRRGWSCGRGSAATAGCPGWAPASPPADSTAARPPQSRDTSSAWSVGKSKDSQYRLIEWEWWTNSHCMFGDGGCWYPNNFGDFRGGLIFKRLPVGLVTQRMRMGSSAADSRLHTAATTATSWPGSLNTNSQPSTRSKS